MEKYVIINGLRYNHGEKVKFKARINQDEEEESIASEVIGCISIPENDISNIVNLTQFYVCQNKHDGALADEKFGYEYSWQVSVNSDGNISSHDTEYIKKLVEIPIFEEETDDDVMPDDWECTEELNQLKIHLNENY